MGRRTTRRPKNKNDDDEIEGGGAILMSSNSVEKSNRKFTTKTSDADARKKKLSTTAEEKEKFQDMGIHITETIDTVNDYDDYDDIEEEEEPKHHDKKGNEQQSKKSCTLGSCLFLSACIACILAGLTIGISYFVLGTPNPLEFFKSNENEGLLNINDKWETPIPGKGGLDLIIENAVDDTWTPILEEYVDKWNNGEPDSLSLTIRRVQVDSSCEPSFGRLRVCNGDYGETSWEGLNLSLVQDGYIRWSTARMNDYFLKNENEVTKRYTMCHELGHGFGLAHSDEEYYNKNRGDCMDYTHRPHGNLSPGKVNWETLEKVYGTSSSFSKRRKRQLLRSPQQKRKRFVLEEEEKEEIPQHIIDEYYSIEEKEYLSKNKDDNEGSYVVDLGDGFHVIVNKMLVIT